MSRDQAAAVFGCRVLAVYVLLLLPWPGWDGFYGRGFRALGNAVFSSDEGVREVTFEPAPVDAGRTAGPSRIVIANRALLAPDGSGPVRNLEVNSRQFGWRPIALLLALLVATPMPGWRRLQAVCWSVPALHGVVLLNLSVCIGNESNAVGLASFPPLWTSVARAGQSVLHTQLMLVAAPLLWVVSAFPWVQRFWWMHRRTI